MKVFIASRTRQEITGDAKDKLLEAMDIPQNILTKNISLLLSHEAAQDLPIQKAMMLSLRASEPTEEEAKGWAEMDEKLLRARLYPGTVEYWEAKQRLQFVEGGPDEEGFYWVQDVSD